MTSMNPFSDNFLNYDDLPIDFTEKFEIQAHLPSPNSDSTGLHTNSVSPPYPIQQDYLAFDVNDQEFIKTQNLYPSYQNQDIFNEVYFEQDGSVSEKSKRIQKRNAAKERTMNKKGATVSFSGVDSGLLPEGYDDPNLDERSKKKMIQMVRNRISAQNSRDRKKNHLSKIEEQNRLLEEHNKSLLNEKYALVQEINGLKEANNRLYQENQSLRQNSSCSSCGGSKDDKYDLEKDNVYIQDSNEEGIPMGGFSGLTSPRLARFSSAGKGFLGFFAVVAFVGFVAVVNVQQGNPAIHFSTQRVLETDNQLKALDTTDVYMNHLDLSSSLVLTNIGQIKNQFELNYEPTFKSHFQNLALSGYIQSNFTYLPNPRATNIHPNAIIQYDAFKESNLRRRTPTIISQTLPVISDGASNLSHTATLFCPSGLEFFDNQNQLSNPDDGYRTNELDLENAEYLQLLVPKSTITRHDTKHIITDIYGIPIGSENRSDEGLLEIWVKVFHMREIHSTYN